MLVAVPLLYKVSKLPLITKITKKGMILTPLGNPDLGQKLKYFNVPYDQNYKTISQKIFSHTVLKILFFIFLVYFLGNIDNLLEEFVFII